MRRCLRQRWLTEQLLDEQDFLQQCLARRAELDVFFGARLDLRSLAADEGSMLFEVEWQLLKELVEASNRLPGPIVEIGTLFGVTTSRMAVWKVPEKRIITVDNYSWNPWKLSPDTHHALTRRCLHYLIETNQVDLRRQDKDAFFAEYQGEPPSLIFLDADHSYEATRDDIRWAQHIGARVIAGHDYTPTCPGVGRAVEAAGGAARHVGGVWALASSGLEPAELGRCRPKCA